MVIIKQIVKKIIKWMRLIAFILWGRNRKFLLINTPIHGNLGDQAIAIAEMQLLKQYRIGTVFEVTANELTGMEKVYARFVKPQQVILITGGGCFGTLWKNEEFRLRRILTSFSKNKIFIFPQTITFQFKTCEEVEFFEQSKEIYYNHEDLTIFIRENDNYQFLQQNMPKLNIVLVPDIVLLLKIPQYDYIRNGILFCMRSDLEKKLTTDELNLMVQMVKTCYPNEEVEWTDTVIKGRIFRKKRIHKVWLKLSQFSKAKLVITDRLHGMVFCALTGTPCIAFGNCNGKVKGVYRWIHELEYVYYVEDVKEFQSTLKKIEVEKKYKFDYDKLSKEFDILVNYLEK